MRWLIEDFRVENGLSALAKALTDLKEDVHIIRYEPFKPVDTTLWSDETEVLLMGSTNICAELWTSRPTWRKGIWANFPNYECLNYLSALPDLCLNSPFTLVPNLDSIWDNRWDLFLQYSSDSCVFIRPTSGDKTFTGSVVDLQNLECQLKAWRTSNPIPCIISTPQSIKAEWRIIVSTKPSLRIAGSSLYRLDGNFTTVPGAPKAALDLALEAASKFQPDPMFTVDIALTNKGYKVVEFNAFSSAAIYACPVLSLIEAIKETYQAIKT
jgi:hypothetical protein